MSQAIALDHVGLATRDVRQAAAVFEALGFRVTPLARHAGGRTANRCVMLDGCYIELMSTIDGGTSATLDRFLARHAGIHILAFRIDDPAAAAARLERAGVGDVRRSMTDRAIDDADPASPRARFSLLTPPDMPEGRVHLIHHLTPEELWQPRFLDHPNGAAALSAVVLAVEHPAETAARLSLRAGRPVKPDPLGGYAMELPNSTIRILSEAGARAALPGVDLPTLPCIAGLMLKTTDVDRVLSRDSGIAVRRQDNAVLADACGAALRFENGQQQMRGST